MDEDQINDEYIFFFVGGSCGSFAKCIFCLYQANLTNSNKKIWFNIDPVDGNCHANNLSRHYHHIDQLDLSKKIVLVDFDDDDIPSIIRMAFHKVVKKQMSQDSLFLETQWGYKFLTVDQTDHNLLESMFLANPVYLIDSTWRDQVNSITPVLTIKFKDIMFGNLSGIIADFFQVPRLPAIEEYINEYRSINQHYLTSRHIL